MLVVAVVAVTRTGVQIQRGTASSGGGAGGTAGSAGSSGTANTGGGGGGGAYRHITAAAGGSGVVIISYTSATQNSVVA
jgi:hypothetical protein